MKIRPRLMLLALTLVAAIGAASDGAWRISRQRAQIERLRAHTVELERQLAGLSRSRDDTQHELDLARQQLATLTTPATTERSPAEQARETEIQSWLARVKRLKQLFNQRPGQRIPEMRLLTDEDWLRLTNDVTLEDDENMRKIFAIIREMAINRFVESLTRALRKFAAANNGAAPADVMAVAPFLANAADVEFLDHYEITNAPTPPRNGLPNWILQQKAPIDADYDNRHYVNASGGNDIYSPPLAWIPNYRERAYRARQNYIAAKGGPAANSIQVLPYFDPPLDAAIVEKILKADRERKP